MSWWQSKSGWVESVKLGAAALAGAAIACAGLYWLMSLAYHGLFH
jgi:hypothetical protein